MKYFNIETINTMEDLKKKYRKLIVKLHPDCGGNTQDFINMKNEYDILFKQLQNKSTNNFEKKETVNQFTDIMDQLVKFDNCNIDIIGTWIWIYGENTKLYKDEIKQLGFLWSSKHKKWFFNGSDKKIRVKNKTTYGEIKLKYGVRSYKTKETLKIS